MHGIIVGNVRNSNPDIAVIHDLEMRTAVNSAKSQREKRRPINKTENSNRKMPIKKRRMPRRIPSKRRASNLMRLKPRRSELAVVAAAVAVDVVAVAIKLNRQRRINSRMLMPRLQSKSLRTVNR